MENDFVTAASLSELSASGRVAAMVNGRSIAIFKVESEIFAIDAECPHRGGPLLAGWVEGERVFCPLHGWEFNLRSGACANGKGIASYPVRVEGDEIRISLAPRE